MSYKKEKLLLEYIISSPEVYALCMPIVKPGYFVVELRPTVSFIHKYYEKYNALPTTDQIEAETKISLRTHEVTKDRISYCTDEIEKFCKHSAVEQAVLTSASLVDTKDYGKITKIITDAILVGLHRDLGLRYFKDPKARLNRMLNEPDLIPTGWKGIDDALYGGLGRREIAFFAGNSGSGKSLTLANLSLNVVNRGFNCLYITNELAQDTVAQRFDTMLTGISRAEWKYHINDISTRVENAGKNKGTIDIIYMSPGSTANDIRSYLKEFELLYKYTPDVIVIDYLDRMRPVELVSADNVFEKDRLITIEARSIGHDYNAAIVTASQLNRESVGSVHHDESHIAGGISKFNESDLWVSILGKMAIKGEAVFLLLKTRNSEGVGKKIWLKYDNKYLRIHDHEKESLAQQFTEKVRPKGDLTHLMRK